MGEGYLVRAIEGVRASANLANIGTSETVLFPSSRNYFAFGIHSSCGGLMPFTAEKLS